MINKVYIIGGGVTRFIIDPQKMKKVEEDFLSGKIKHNTYDLMLSKGFIDLYGKENVLNCQVRGKGEYKNILWHKGFVGNYFGLFKELWINRKHSLFFFNGMYPWVLIYSLIPGAYKACRRHALIGPYKKCENKIKRVLLFLIQIFFQFFIDTIFYVNEPEKKELKKYHFLGNKYFLPIPINISFRSHDTIKKLEKNKLIISSTGSICKRKNQKLILEAIAKIRNIKPELEIHLNLIGGSMLYHGLGADTYGNKIRNFLKYHNINHVYFKGHISAEELKKVYGETDVFIQASFTEGLCQTYIEAGLCGCPLILSDIPTFRDTAKDFALFFDPRDSEELAKRILEMIDNIEYYKIKSIEFKKYLKNRGYNSFTHQLESFNAKFLTND